MIDGLPFTFRGILRAVDAYVGDGKPLGGLKFCDQGLQRSESWFGHSFLANCFHAGLIGDYEVVSGNPAQVPSAPASSAAMDLVPIGYTVEAHRKIDDLLPCLPAAATVIWISDRRPACDGSQRFPVESVVEVVQGLPTKTLPVFVGEPADADYVEKVIGILGPWVRTLNLVGRLDWTDLCCLAWNAGGFACYPMHGAQVLAHRRMVSGIGGTASLLEWSDPRGRYVGRAVEDVLLALKEA